LRWVPCAACRTWYFSTANLSWLWYAPSSKPVTRRLQIERLDLEVSTALRMRSQRHSSCMTSASLFRMGCALLFSQAHLHEVSSSTIIIPFASLLLQFLMIAGGLAGYLSSGSVKSLGALAAFPWMTVPNVSCIFDFPGSFQCFILACSCWRSIRSTPPWAGKCQPQVLP
jgi:hypothetical protein